MKLSTNFISLIEAFGLKVSSALLMLIFAFSSARLFSVTDAGIVMYFVSLTALIGMAATMGLGMEATRISALLVENKIDQGNLPILFKIILAPVVIFFTGLSILFFFEDLIPESYDLIPTYLVLCSGCLIALNKIFCAILQGLSHFKKSIFFDQILWLLLSIFLIIISSGLFDNPLESTFRQISLSIAFSVSITFILLWGTLLRLYKSNSLQLIKYIFQELRFSKSDIKLFQSAFWLSALLIVAPFLNNFVSGILLTTGEDYELASFQVSVKLVAALALFPVVFNYVFAPNISRYYSKNNLNELTNLFINARNTVFLLTIPVTLIFIIFSSYILGLFGSSYSEGVQILIILLFGQLVSTYFGSCVSFLVLSNNAKWAGISGIISLFLSTGSYYLFDYFGSRIDEVIMIVIFQFVWNWLCCIGVKKTLDINVFYFPSIKIARKLICSVKV